MADRTIRHAIFLERLKATQVNKIVRLVNASNKDVFNILEKRLANIATRGFDTSTFATQRLRQLAVSTGNLVRVGARNTMGVLKKDLQDIAISEADFQIKMFKDLVPLDLSYITPGETLLKSIVTKRPFQGKLLKEWIQDFGTNTRKNIITQLNMGMVQGESIPQLVNRLRAAGGVADRSRKEIARIVRTAVNHTTTQARELTYEANEDVVKGVQWLSTLDRKTSEICITLDGKVFPVGKGQRPPAHLQCRSTTTPVLKSFEELGIPINEIEPGTRASMNGQVPAKTTYKTWLRKQPKEVQNQVLGVGKAKLFRSGKLKLDRLPVDGRPLTLQQLRVKEGLSSPSIASPIPQSPVIYKAPDPNLPNLNAPKQLKNMMEIVKKTGVNPMEIGKGLDTIHLQTATAHTRWMKDAFPKLRTALPGSVNKVRFYDGKLPGTPGYQGLFNYEKKILSVGNTKGQIATANNTLGGWSVDKSVAGTFRHELGHGMDWQGMKFNKGKSWEGNVWNKMTKSDITSQVSKYAATNERELWAESFCAYTNPTYALEGKRLPKLIEDFFETALGKHPNLVVTPKPIVVPKLPVFTKAVEPSTFGVVKPVLKTPIKKTVIQPTKIGKVPPPSEQLGSQVINKLKVKDQIALFNELEATGVTGPRLEAAKAAIMDSGTQTAIIRRGSGKIEGAISFYTKEGELVISNIGSLGNVKGGGTELLRVAVRRAAKENLGMTFQAADGAIPYFQKLGFSTSGNVVSASPARVKQMRTALGKRGRSIANPTGKGASTTKILKTTTAPPVATPPPVIKPVVVKPPVVKPTPTPPPVVKPPVVSTPPPPVVVKPTVAEVIPPPPGVIKGTIPGKIPPPPTVVRTKVWNKLGYEVRRDLGDAFPTPNDVEKRHKMLWPNKGAKTVIATSENGRIIGTLKYEIFEDVVKVSGTRRKLGTEGLREELLRAPVRAAAKANVGLELTVTRHELLEFYRSLGFNTDGTRVFANAGRIKTIKAKMGLRNKGGGVTKRVLAAPGEGTDLIKIHETKNTSEWLSKLRPNERASIGHYTGSGYVTVNKTMAGVVEGTKVTKDTIAEISAAMNRRPPIRQKELFRGMGWSAGDKGIKPWITEGETIDVKSFFSSSVKESFAKGWVSHRESYVVLKIRNPKNALDIRKITRVKGEGEFLFAPQKYKIISVKRIPGRTILPNNPTYGGWEVVVDEVGNIPVSSGKLARPIRAKTEAAWLKGLSKEVKESVKDFTHDQFGPLNNYMNDPVKWKKGWLRYQPKAKVEALEAFNKQNVENIKAALKSAPVFKGDVFRGMSDLTPKALKAWTKVGAKVESKSFLSATVKESTARRFGRKNATNNWVEIKFKSKTGVDITPLSAKKGEKEILFDPTKFRIKKVTKTIGKSRDFGDVRGYVIEIVEI